MESLLPSPTISTAVGILASLLLFLYYLFQVYSAHKNTAKKKIAPEATGAWPVIGHLHLLANSSQLPHVTLGNMAEKYGPIFKVKFGVHPALVVSSWEMAKECFTTNDRAFSNRPKAIVMEHMGYNYAMFVFSPYGPYWRQVRKIAAVEFLTSHRRRELLSSILESEVRSFTKGIYEQWVKNKNSGSSKVMVEMKRWIGDITLNVVLRLVAGKRYVEANGSASSEDKEGDRCRKALDDFFHCSGWFFAADAIPFLRWFDFGGYEGVMRRVAKEMDSVLQGWLDEHKSNRLSGQVKGEQDFMDVMLSTLEGGGEEPSVYDADTINKSTCLALIFGGTDTTVPLTWALSLLLNTPHVLRKAQEELETHVGKERRLNEGDMKNLVYLQAIIKESMRLYPGAPILPPREAISDCNIGGYHVPKGTRLMVNLHKIHRDPRVWSDPDEFKPERFLTTHKNVDLKGQHFDLLPFGSGRRVCPAISYALQEMQFILGSLLHEFGIATPSGEPVDMSECPGLATAKATPLNVLLTPRLPHNLYG